MLTEEALMWTSFLESIRDQSDTSLSTKFYQYNHGTQKFVDALKSTFKVALSDVRRNAEVKKIKQTKDKVLVEVKGLDKPVEADYCIVTVPFSRLKYIDTTEAGIDGGLFSDGKRKSIRELHYDNSGKIALVFSDPWWLGLGINNGASVTDLPVRWVFYPSHNWIKRHNTAVMLASYTWSDDAQSFIGMSDEDAVKIALENVIKIHTNTPDGDPSITPEYIRSTFIGGRSWNWTGYEWTLGAFAIFSPGQQRELYERGFVTSQEGRISFAGEHTTIIHAWIEGAIQSGLRAAAEIIHQILPNTRGQFDIHSSDFAVLSKNIPQPVDNTVRVDTKTPIS